MLLLLLAIFTIVFIIITIYLTLPPRNKTSQKIYLSHLNDPKEKTIISNPSGECNEDKLNLQSAKDDILNRLDQLKLSFDKKLHRDANGPSLSEEIQVLEEEIKHHLATPINDIEQIKNIIDPLKEKLSLPEINHIFSIINDFENKMRSLLAEYTDSSRLINEIHNLGEQIKQHLAPSISEIANLNNIIHPLADKLSLTEINRVFNNINDFETKIKKILSEYTQPTEMLEEIHTLGKVIKQYLELPIRDITDLKNIIVPLKDKLSLVEINKIFTIVSGIEVKIRSLMSEYTNPLNDIVTKLNEEFAKIYNNKNEIIQKVELVKSLLEEKLPSGDRILTSVENQLKTPLQCQLPVDEINELKTQLELINSNLVKVNTDKLDVINTLVDIKTSLNGKLFSLGDVIAEITSLENELKSHFQIPIKNIKELKEILDPVKSKLSKTEIEKALNTINGLESKIKKILTESTKTPLESINNIIRQFENTDLKQDITNIKTETENVLRELKTLCKNADIEQVVDKLTALEANFNSLMGQKIEKVLEILRTLENHPPISAVGLKSEMDNLKKDLMGPFQNIAELKSAITPINFYLRNMVSLLNDMEEAMVRRLSGKMIEIDRDVISRIDKLENKFTDLFRNVGIVTGFVNRFEDPSNEIGKVFFTLQRICGSFDVFEKTIKQTLNLESDKELTYTQFWEGVRHEQELIIRNIIGTDFASFKDSIDVLINKTLSKQQFEGLKINILNAIDNNLQQLGLENKINDITNSIQEARKEIERVTTNTNLNHTDIKVNLNALSLKLENKIESSFTDMDTTIKSLSNIILQAIKDQN